VKTERIPTVRLWLALVVLACVVPALLAAVPSIYYFYQRERAQLVREAIATARALTQAVDRDLASAHAALLVLSTSPDLASGDLAAFHRQATEALRGQVANNVVLTDSTGQQLVNTLRPFGEPLPRHGNPAQLRRIFETGRPSVSDLYVGAVTRRPLIGIEVPVRRGDTVIYDLAMGIFPERLSTILAQQRLPPDWIGAIFDSTGTLVARTHENERFVGQKGVPALVQRMKEVDEGAIETDTLEGIPVFSAFSRSAVSNWTVAIGIPRASLTEALRRSLAWLIVGSAVLLAGGFILASVIGGRIVRSLQGLIAPALALGLGDPPIVPPLGLKEADQVGNALLQASRAAILRTHELETAHERLRRLIENSPSGMLTVDGAGHIVLVNAQVERLFGYTRGELQGKPVEFLVPARFRATHESDREQFLVTPATRPMGAGRELYGLRKDGTEFPLEIGVTHVDLPEGAGVLATIVDISERKRLVQAEALAAQAQALQNEIAERRRSEAQLEAFMNNSPSLMFIKDLAGRYLRVNEPFLRAFRIARDRVISRTDAEIFSPEQARQFEVNDAEALASERAIQVEETARYEDGLHTSIVCKFPIIDGSGRAAALGGIVTDITDRIRVEQALQESLAEKELLLKEIHHRVKNNLQIVTGLLTLQAGRLESGARDAVEECADRIHSLALLHERLYREGHFGTVHLGDYIEGIVTMLMQGQAQAGVSVRVDIPPGTVDLDTAVPLGQAVTELTTNALKHAFRQREAGTVRVALTAAGDRLVLEISDDGVGLSGGEPREGAIGLRMVKLLAKQLGGEFSISSSTAGTRAALAWPGSLAP
jgi:PAS domain S-box-containing protein